mmetsp:Transcript_18932/g.34713  ORF Transcript_18932/g.34713 Transcript_18932/m.34713 type:complete len:548 (+) Transcript_18932:87-1730(+)
MWGFQVLCVLGAMAHAHLHLGMGKAPQGDLKGYEFWWTQNLTEVEVATPLNVEGKIPAWLSGSLVRNGPGLFEKGGQVMHHQFDGLSKPNKWRIHEGEVFFQTRFLRSHMWNTTNDTQRVPEHMTMLPMTPKYTMKQRIDAMENSNLLDNPNIFIWKTGDAHFATADMGKQIHFDLDSLDSLGYMEYQGDHDDQFTGAHKQPAFAQEGSGETIGWTGSINVLGLTMKLKVHRDSPNFVRQFIGEVNVDWLALIHSFAVTKNYVLIMIPNVGIDVMKMGKEILFAKEFDAIQGMKWHGDKKAKVYVFDAHSQDPKKAPLRTFEADPMYFNHHVNAYEEDGNIVMDLIGYDNGDFISDPHGFANLDVMKDPEARSKLVALNPQFRRYRMNMAKGSANHINFDEIKLTDGKQQYNIEMPRFNEYVRRGQPYCFVYGMSSADHVGMLPSLAKADLCDAGKVRQWFEPNQYPSEVIFVPRPDATDEDDGVLVTQVLDGTTATSYLLVLDAKTMTTLAKAHAPVWIPYDVHGQFFPDATMYHDKLAKPDAAWV